MTFVDVVVLINHKLQISEKCYFSYCKLNNFGKTLLFTLRNLLTSALANVNFLEIFIFFYISLKDINKTKIYI